jgi:hypothetical protein
VIKVSKFRFSHRPYAVDLSSFRVTSSTSEESVSCRVTFDAVWFRGPKTAPKACIGQLREYVSLAADHDPERVLLSMDDGRYGGDCLGRWNGTGYWGSEDPDVQAEHLAILRPMLENFPAIPRGFDGWWTFP